MDEPTTFASLLRRYIGERGYSLQRLADDADVPKPTIGHWLTGKAKRPYFWEEPLQVAAALGLNKISANRLLRAAGHPPVEVLRETAKTGAQRALLARWEANAPHNLPAQMTSFIGRGDEILDIAELLTRRDVRLVTLTGPGGSGKTRLALEIAAALLDVFHDGIWFVDLTPLTEPPLVIPTIARTLGIRDAAGDLPTERLKEHLREWDTLLLLDNFERVVQAGPEVVAVLRAAPRVKVLATSRVPLHVSGEHERPVPPLTPPPTDAPFTVVSRSPAVALFATRAGAANPGFALTAKNAPAVAEICHQLDGLPLAVELAAARSRQFAPGELLARFPGRLDLSADGPLDAPERHRALRATIAWSYELLGAEEKVLFARLAVFVGGWATEAAAVVCGGAYDRALDVPRRLELLRELNLLTQHTAAAEPRYAMLETIREYALERLEEGGEAEELRRRHSEYYLELAETTGSQLGGPEEGAALDRLEEEHDNLRAALSWLLEQDEVEAAARLAARLWGFWYRHGYLSEGKRWLEAVLATGDRLPAFWRVRVLCPAGVLALEHGEHERATALFEESLVVAQKAGDKPGMASSLNNLGLVASDLLPYKVPGVVAADHTGYERATAVLEQSLALYTELENKWGMALVLNNLGWAAVKQGEHERAKQRLESCLAVAREIGDRWSTALALNNLGLMAVDRRDCDEAVSPLAESMALSRELGHKDGIAYNLEGFASVAGLRGQPARAARLFGAADALRKEFAPPRPPSEISHLEHHLAISRSQLDDAAWMEAYAQGQNMPLEPAIAESLGEQGAALETA